MRKRTVVLVLAMVFSLSIVGCGNDSEPKREEVQAEKQEVEQEETKADAEVEQEEVEEETEQEEETSNTIAENDVLVITGEEGRYSEYDLQAFEEVSECGEEKSFNEDAPVYSEEGTQVGYIKKGSTIFIDESLNLMWFRFKNPLEGTEYDNLYVLQDYFADAQDYSVSVDDNTDEVIDDPKTAYVIFDLELQNNFEKDGRRKYDGDGIQINIPMSNTQKWAEEKVGQFKEKGITTYYMEGSDGENGNLRIDIWMFNENGILTTEEMQEIFK